MRSSSNSQRIKLCPASPVWHLPFLTSVHGLFFSFGWDPEHHTYRGTWGSVLRPQAVEGWCWMVQKEKAGDEFIHTNKLEIWCQSILLSSERAVLVYESAESDLAALGWAHSCTGAPLAGLLWSGWARMAWIWWSWLCRMCLSYFSSRLIAEIPEQKTWRQVINWDN